MQKIMVVDDEEDILCLVGFLLERHAFTVMQVADCKTAIAAVLEWKPDLIIFDINLGMCDGRQLCYELKTIYSFTAPIILFSANNELSRNFTRYKANSFIAKPFCASELVSIIREQLHVG